VVQELYLIFSDKLLRGDLRCMTVLKALASFHNLPDASHT